MSDASDTDTEEFDFNSFSPKSETIQALLTRKKADNQGEKVQSGKRVDIPAGVKRVAVKALTSKHFAKKKDRLEFIS